MRSIKDSSVFLAFSWNLIAKRISPHDYNSIFLREELVALYQDIPQSENLKNVRIKKKREKKNKWKEHTQYRKLNVYRLSTIFWQALNTLKVRFNRSGV